MEKQKKVKKFTAGEKVGFILLPFFTLVMAATMAVGAFFYNVVTTFLMGSGVVLEQNEQTTTALEFSDNLCREIASEGIVLLKNEDDLLPLTKADLAQVNVFGWRSTNAGWIGGASGSVNGNNNTARLKVRTFLDSLEESGFEYNTEITDIYESFSTKTDGKALNDGVKFFTLTEPQVSVFSNDVIERAKEFSETAFVVFGRQGGEGCDLPKYQQKYGLETDTTRPYLDISTEEEALLDMVTTNFENVIVIVNAVNLMNTSFLDRYENIDSALWCSGTGQSGVYSLLRMLRGKITPSAKLTNTMPYNYADDPTYVNITGADGGKGGGIVYAEDIYLGYKWYETAYKEGFFDEKTLDYEVLHQDGTRSPVHKTGYDAVVQYPLGYGLSYTDFEWKLLSSTATTSPLTKDTTLEFTVEVENVGDRKGKDIIEVYYEPPYTKNGIEKSDVNLVAFAKTSQLLPGDTEEVKLSFKVSDMKSYDCYDKNSNGFFGYEVEPGSYNISFRTDAHTLKEGMAGNKLTYSVTNGIKYDKDPETELEIKNVFTNYTDGDGSHVAYGNTPIDGSTLNKNIKYLSRADFAGTFPQAYGAIKGAGYSQGAYTPDVPLVTESNFGQNNGKLLYTTETGGKPTRQQLQANEGIKMNETLMLELGNYDSPVWDDVLDQMTKDEMHLLMSQGGYHTEIIESIGKKYMLDNDGGSGLNRHIQEADQGYNPNRASWTLFPSTNMLAASWNEKLSYNYGLGLANEAVSTGIDGWYSPSCNMHRSQYDGRISEYVSEDSFISGKITAAQVRGCNNNGVYTYVKHFAVNENETGRGGINTWLTEQNLRENYLRSFEITVKEGKTPGIMASMNSLAAIPTQYNKGLLTDILRKEWKFEGCVITDYVGSGDLKRATYAGLDMLLNGANYAISGGWTGSDMTFLTFARQSCKNILFMKAHAYKMNVTHDKSEDVITSDSTIIVAREVPFGWWYVILGGVTFGLVVGDVVFAICTAKNVKKRKKAAAAK